MRKAEKAPSNGGLISKILNKLSKLTNDVDKINSDLYNNEVLISTLTPSKTTDTVPNLSTLKETYKKVRIEIWYEQKSVLASTTAFLSDDLTGIIDCIFYDGNSANEIRARYIDTTFKLMDVGSDQTNYCGAKMYGIKL